MKDAYLEALNPPQIRNLRIPSPAETSVEGIFREMGRFEASLTEKQELGMCIVGGPVGLCVHVREVRRCGGDKLVFVGIDSDENPVRLVQHFTQLNLLMTAVPKIGPVAVRLGFHAPSLAAQ